MTITQRLRCLFGRHSYTTAAMEGIPATAEQLADPFWGFWDYAKMYCRHCGHEAAISRETRAQHPMRTNGTC